MFEFSDITVGNVLCADWKAAAAQVAKQETARVLSAMLEGGVVVEATINEVRDEVLAWNSDPWPLSDNPWGSVRDRLAMRSGGGMKSIAQSAKTDVEPGTGNVAGQISTGTMAIHETGGVIRAVRAKFLCIPLRAALDSRGLPLRVNARAWDKTFVHKSKKGNLIIFRRDGKTLVPLYLLKASVTIPARLQLGETFDKNVSYFETKALKALDAELLD